MGGRSLLLTPAGAAFSPQGEWKALVRLVEGLGSWPDIRTAALRHLVAAEQLELLLHRHAGSNWEVRPPEAAWVPRHHLKPPPPTAPHRYRRCIPLLERVCRSEHMRKLA